MTTAAKLLLVLTLLAAVAESLVPIVERASCVFQRGGNISGHVSFTRRGDALDTTVTYSMIGLTEGSHMWHVHMYGDVSQDSSMASTGGHFYGKPPTGRTEIANFAEPGTTITADALGAAAKTFADPELRFSGENSIIGRSIVVHGDATSAGVRVAMCVIGIAEEGGSTGAITVTPPLTTFELGKRSLTARVSGKRVVSTNGPIQQYEGYTGTATFQGNVRVTEKPAGLVTQLDAITGIEASRVPAGTVTVVETINGEFSL
jgi:Cu-Zn family superoxide dismutase